MTTIPFGIAASGVAIRTPASEGKRPWMALPLVNADASLGLAGWRVRYTAPLYSVEPDGTGTFMGADAPLSGMGQAVPIPASFIATVDAGQVSLMANWNARADERGLFTLTFRFLDASGAEISSETSLPTQTDENTIWKRHCHTASVPVDTRSVEVALLWDHVTGTNITYRVNDLEVLVIDDAEVETLPIVNPDATLGSLAGWTITVGPPEESTWEGKSCFYGGEDTTASSFYQDVDIPQDWWSRVDAGVAELWVDHHQSHYDWDDDPGRVNLYFLSDVGGTLDTVSEDYELADDRKWMHKLQRVVVPAGSRAVRFEIQGERWGGSNCNFYITGLRARLAQR